MATANAQLIFHHDTEGDTYGRSDKNGYYVMERTVSQAGAFIGENRVSLTTTVVFGDEDDLTDEQLIEDDEGSFGIKERVPEKYRGEQSELIIEVTDGGAPYDIPLTSD